MQILSNIKSAALAVFLVCLQAEARGFGEESDQCYTDSECETRCCNTEREYFEAGSCVEIKDLPRCEERKKNHRIALYIILGITAIIIFVCTYLKKDEKEEKKVRMEALKLRKAQEESHRARGKTETPVMRGTRLSAGVTNSLPNQMQKRMNT